MSKRTSTVATANSKRSSSVLGAFELMTTVWLTFYLRQAETELAYDGRLLRGTSSIISQHFAISKYVGLLDKEQTKNIYFEISVSVL